ncbi:galactose-specific lectin nattectin-like [Sphaeramia orbicularis]|uniref:Galactose-specific lectin nattectin-like n=1 Tax=Sphaeramia orbicularis TaxID=375764 RepID=A0A673C4K8_9TELE|nr:galactose-specific lectin nattectin-like [Sphaeramia orbicularis]
MASTLFVIAFLCGLWIEANAQTDPGDFCQECPPGWTTFDKRCYLFHKQEKDWADAERTCTSLGANLASIRNAGVYKFLRQMILRVTGSNKKTWAGGYDAPKEGVWLWSDGFHFDFKAWPKGEPNNLGGEHCMEFNLRGKDYVNDAKCTTRNSFICAKDP